MIVTARVSKNSEVFKDILCLYAKENDIIADVTFGVGKFWKEINVSKYELLATDLQTGTDLRKLPYQNESINMVVLDPPYIYNPSKTIKESISNTYNINQTEQLVNNNAVLSLYFDGMKEAFRVIKKNGFLIVKCQDIIESNKQKWNHVEILKEATKLNFIAEDLFIVVQTTTPCQRWKIQKHARKNHSYFWIFKK